VVHRRLLFCRTDLPVHCPTGAGRLERRAVQSWTGAS
jgi:hypothetical protein